MIIIWSWKAGSLGEEEWHIASTQQANDRVICRDWPVSPANLQQLGDLIASRRQLGDVMVFLHRFHGYHQEHIQQLSIISHGGGQVRCYLFGEGANAIYLTRDPRGLLGTSGTFSAQVSYEGQPVMYVTSIADQERRELNPVHFNYVWQRYQFALRARIFELQEELLAEFQDLLPRTVLEPGEAYQLLRQPQHKGMLLRLLSFVNRLRKGSDLAQELRQLERQTSRALSFDDCGVQLGKAYGETTAAHYQELANHIQRHLLGRGEATDLQVVRRQFDDLLNLIPGSTYN